MVIVEQVYIQTQAQEKAQAQYRSIQRKQAIAARKQKEARRKSFHDLSILHITQESQGELSIGAAKNGIELLQIPLHMTPSANRQFAATINAKTKRGMLYKPAAFKRIQSFIREQVSQAVKQRGWTTFHSDWYMLILDFPFHNIVREDVDGPLKPMIDCLKQQAPSRREKEEMLYLPEAIAAWIQDHPAALLDDSQVLQVVLNKHLYSLYLPEEEPQACVTICKITPQSPWYGHLVPLDLYLLNRLCYTIPTDFQSQ